MKMCAVEFVFVKFRSKNNNNYIVRSFRLLQQIQTLKMSENKMLNLIVDVAVVAFLT